MVHRLVLAGFFIMLSMGINAQQNLVPNSGFENFTYPPSGISQLYLAHPWVSFSTDSGPVPADYFHSNASNELAGIPENYLGEQTPHTGQAYAGLIAYSEDYPYYREFIQVVLKQPLKKDSLYYAELFLSLAEKRTLAIGNMGMLFTKEDPFETIKSAYYSRNSNGKVNAIMKKQRFFKDQPQVVSRSNQIQSDNIQWQRLAGAFKAIGGEVYLTIGNFTKRKQVVKQQVSFNYGNPSVHNDAYYYIDDVKVLGLYDRPPGTDIAKKVPELKQKEKEPDLHKYFGQLDINQPFVLRNVYFESDEYILQPQSYMELNQLYDFLTSDPTILILIEGHTDNTNTEDYNNILSQLRAEAVKQYLANKGIPLVRIDTKGYGEYMPIADNSSEEGKKLNRRVTFKIISRGN